MHKVKEDIQRLHELIRQHDVIFLLTDSRESRWLPTVIGSVEKKVFPSKFIEKNSISFV